MGASLQAAQALTEGRRGPAFNHYKATADAMQSLSWVVYTGPNCGVPVRQLPTLTSSDHCRMMLVLHPLP